MNVKNLLILLASSFILSGCSAFGLFGGPDVKEIQVKSVTVEKTPLNLDYPTPLKPKKIQWFVITPENYEEVFANLEKKKYSVVLYGLTDDGYQHISSNLAELRAYIMQQRNIIKAYKDYYEPKKLEDPK